MAAKTKTPAKVRWGIISTAEIGTGKVIPGMMKSKKLEIRALASRDLAKAKRATKKLGIPVAYGSYEELFDDPEIDAIYNPLPNHLHVPLTLAAAKKGKHVLCEKPISLNAAEARKLKRAPKDVLIAEAFMIRAHPQWIRARDMVRAGKLGEIRYISTAFSYYNDDPDNIRNMADIGGGGMYDIGCYAILSARYVLDAEPKRVVSIMDLDPVFKTDRTASGLVDFGEGRQLSFSISTQSTGFQRVQIVGTKARLEINIPFNAPQNDVTLIKVDNGKKLGDASARAIKIPVSDQYQLQGEVFSAAVRGQTKLEFGVDDAIQQMRVIDAMFKSAKENRWVKL